MTPSEFEKKTQAHASELERFINDQLPRRIGKMAVDHFKDNFRKGGFVNNGLKVWDKPKRFSETGKSAGSRYGTLLSARNELFNSINYSAKNGLITISSDKEYSQIHNEGGEVNNTIAITPKMRKFAWAKNYETGDDKWKGLALTQKETIHVQFTMPKRQFIGESAELNSEIIEMVETQISKILNS